MAPLGVFFLAAAAVELCQAIPTTGLLPRADPIKLTLQKHVLTNGTRPKNPGRLSKGGRRVPQSNSSVSEGLQDYYLGTDLQWYGALQVGTPPQNFTVVFDTGSPLTVIPGMNCTTCGNQHKFNSSASSTFLDHDEQDQEGFLTGVGVDPSDYEAYDLEYVRDALAFAGLSAGEIDFYLVTDETAGFLNDPFDGLVGMSPFDNDTIFQNLVDNGLPGLFSLALLPKGTNGSEITLGGIDTTKFTEPLTYMPLRSSSFWVLDSSQFSVNGQTSPLPNDTVPIIFDSGTSNVILPTDVANTIYALISPNIKPFGDFAVGGYGIPCSEIDSIKATLDFTFISTEGTAFNLTIPPEELNVGPFASDPTMCQTLINAIDGYYILGGSVLKHYYSVWDQENLRMGFSPTSS